MKTDLAMSDSFDWEWQQAAYRARYRERIVAVATVLRQPSLKVFGIIGGARLKSK